MYGHRKIDIPAMGHTMEEMLTRLMENEDSRIKAMKMLNWQSLTRSSEVSIDFIKSTPDWNWDQDAICARSDISFEFITNNLNRFDRGKLYSHIYGNPAFDILDVLKFADGSLFPQPIMFSVMSACSTKKLSPEFVKISMKHIDTTLRWHDIFRLCDDPQDMLDHIQPISGAKTSIYQGIMMNPRTDDTLAAECLKSNDEGMMVTSSIALSVDFMRKNTSKMLYMAYSSHPMQPEEYLSIHHKFWGSYIYNPKLRVLNILNSSAGCNDVTLIKNPNVTLESFELYADILDEECINHDFIRLISPDLLDRFGGFFKNKSKLENLYYISKLTPPRQRIAFFLN